MFTVEPVKTLNSQRPLLKKKEIKFRFIKSMNLSHSLTNSLIATLKNIDTTSPSACGKLNAFINKVNVDLTNGSLTEAQANSFLSPANAIKGALGCQ